MEPYFEFYSDLDLILTAIENLMDKCHEWWVNDVPFSEKEQDSSRWDEFENRLNDIHSELNEEPFYEEED